MRTTDTQDESPAYRTFLIPDTRDGLTRIQEDCITACYTLPSSRSYARSFRVLSESYQIPLGVFYLEFFRLIRQHTLNPLFIELPTYDWLIDFPAEPAEILQSPAFQEFLASQRLPEFTEFGKDMVRDLQLTYYETDEHPAYIPCPIPVRLPLYLVAATCFDYERKTGTNIPPHNISEVIDAIIAYLESPTINAASLGEIIRGPDFPAGGRILTAKEELLSAYSSGVGTILHKCDAYLKQDNTIVVPIMDPAATSQRIATSIRDAQITGIASLIDHGSELVITVLEGLDLNRIKSSLCELPDLTKTIRLDMTALVIKEDKQYVGPPDPIYYTFDGIPVIQEEVNRLTLAEIIGTFIDNRLRFLIEMHKWSKERAIKEFKQDLLELKGKYGIARRTQINAL